MIYGLKPFVVVMVILVRTLFGWYQANAAVENGVILVAICGLGQTSLTSAGVFCEGCYYSTMYGI
jgi:hypothetical protein